ncbi:MAG: hypothetical protein WHS38_03740 [Thermodesulforhabdaceae bacterium]
MKNKTFSLTLLLIIVFCEAIAWAQQNPPAEETQPSKAVQQDLVVENNLFSPTRTPPSTSKQHDNATTQISPSDLQLDGVILTKDKKRAIFKVNPNILGDEKAKKNPYVTVPEGGQIGSYKIISVQKNQVIADQNGQQVVIPLIKTGKAPSPITVHLPTVSLSPATPTQSAKQPPAPQPPAGAGHPSPKGTTPAEPAPGEQIQPQSQPLPSPFQGGQAEVEEVSTQPPLPAPEDFEKLSPEQKEEVIKKMQSTMERKIKSNIQK